VPPKSPRKQVEVFTDGTPLCVPTVELVLEVAQHCDVTIYDVKMDDQAVRRSAELGVIRLPAVVVDGVILLGDWRGIVSRAALWEAGVD
jgi:hypothetical protein